ncbi:TonB-dependent receptor [Xylophilus sp. GW821-FHT01B05]
MRALVVGGLLLRMGAVGAIATLAPLPASAIEAADAASIQDYAIAPGRLGDVLAQFAGAAGVPLSFDPHLLDGLQSSGLQGRYAVGSGFGRLLAGSGFEAVDSGSGRYVLQRKGSRPESEGAAPALPAVLVTARAERADDLPEAFAGGQIARGGRAGFLGNVDVMDTPLSTVNYTAQAIDDQQARTVGEVIAADASVRLTSQSYGVTESYAIRGFPINDGNIGDVSFDGLYGVAPNYQTSAAYAERVELIKGPTALLNGIAPNGALGGGLNIVPKRAGAQPLTRMTLDYATRSQAGAHVDVGRRFGDNQEWGVRVNGVLRDGDTERDKQNAHTQLGAIALDYKGSQLRASLDYVNQQLTVDAPTRQPMLAAGVRVPEAPDARRNLAQPWDRSVLRDQSLLARVDYEISDRLGAYFATGASRSATDGLYSNPMITDASGQTTMLPSRISLHLRKWTAEAGLRGRWRTGAVEHRWTLGANVYHDEMDVGFNFASTPLGSNIYDPIDFPKVDLSRPAEMAFSRTTLRGLALADTMALADDRVLLTLGLRQQQVRSVNPAAGTRDDEHALTPMVGLVVKPWPNVSLFANYIQGLNVGDTAPTNSHNAGEVFKPYKAKQYEAGVKYEAAGWLATASVFQIGKPSGQLGTDGYYRPNAEQRNRGLEVSLAGEPVRGLRPMASLSLLDGELTRASAAVQGNDAPGVPRVQANLGLEWDVPGVPGLTLTGRTLYTSSQYVDQANTQRLPAWWRFDPGARYATRIASRPVVFRAQIFNLADRHYWSGVTSWGGLAMGDTRTVRVSMQVDF